MRELAVQAGPNSELANLTSSNQAVNQARVQAPTRALAIYNSIQGNELSLIRA